MIDPKLNATDQLCVNTIRTLSIDAVQKANSGHPGAPMGAALMAYVLWDRLLRHNPADVTWPDRDRFVLSAGHASMLLYSLQFMYGYPGITLDDIKSFRQWGSPTAGHPESELLPGTETTTGPLGQGLATAVGMAMAERFLAATFNRPGHTVIDHCTYVLASDGDIQEGVSHEAASFAGYQRLGKLIVLYDDNQVQLDGPTALSFSEDVHRRFEAYGWHAVRIDGMDPDAVEAALASAKADARPSIICARTHIGYGSPNRQDSSKAHGAPLGEDEVKLTKKAYGWPEDARFLVPGDALAHTRSLAQRGASWQRDWRQRLEAYEKAFPAEARQLRDAFAGRLPAGWSESLPAFAPGDKEIATRVASGAALNAMAGALPLMIGGSADLGESNNTELKGQPAMSRDEPAGRNVYYGVREHAMAAALNGMAAHGGVIPYGGTFLVFSDYHRPSIRIAALSGFGSIFVYTHDSVGLGEDGPTHQPIEHLAALRAIPKLYVIRPADPNETMMAWKVALDRRRGPTALALSRQAVPHLAGTANGGAVGLLRGGYVLSEAEGGRPDALIIATGSEVGLAVDARTILLERGVCARVVSLPCWELFDEQPSAYRDEVLPPAIRCRVSIEAAVTQGWQRWVGDDGIMIGIDGRFGASAPYKTIMQKLGFTAENVAERTLALVERLSGVKA
jgi:transketolase